MKLAGLTLIASMVGISTACNVSSNAVSRVHSRLQTLILSQAYNKGLPTNTGTITNKKVIEVSFSSYSTDYCADTFVTLGRCGQSL